MANLLKRLDSWSERCNNGLMSTLERFHQPNQAFDHMLLFSILFTMLIGFVMVFSASLAEGTALTDDPFFFVKRHLIFLAGSLVITLIVMSIKVELWQKLSWTLPLLSLFLLVLVAVAGKNVNGSTRWLAIGSFNLQVAEVVKFFFTVYLADYLVRYNEQLSSGNRGFVKPLFLFGILSAFLLYQPDMGSFVVLFVITTGLLWLAGAQLKHFFLLIVSGAVAVGFLIKNAPYRLTRFQTFLDPWEDPFGAGFQLVQSLMAYGRGEWWGQGLGNSIQKLEYLPEAHTDFIFAIIAEELGFAGVSFILILLLFMTLRMFHIGSMCLKVQRVFPAYVSYGISIWFGFQVFVNVGVSNGLLPTKGLTLPFISYGGSSLWIMTAAVMLVLRIDYERRAAEQYPIQPS